MKLIEKIRIAFSNLGANKMRSALTILGISVGIAAIVFLVSLGYGLQQLSIQKIASIEAINTLDVAPGTNSLKKIDNVSIKSIKDMPEVSEVSPFLALGLKITYEGQKTDAVGNFVDDSYSSLEGTETIVGGFFSNTPSDLVVSTALLKILNISPTDAVDKKFSTIVVMPESGAGKATKEAQKEYRIVGVVQDDATSYAYVSLDSVSSDLPDDIVYNSLKVKSKDQAGIPGLREKITTIGFTVTSIADTIDQVYQVFRIIQIVLALFGFIALLVASIGMFNTMTIALLERTRDIGVMKAIGIKNRDVAMIFLAESSLIAFSGGVLGVAIGWITAKIINYAVNYLAQSVGGQPETIFVMPGLYAAAIIVFSFFVGLATGFYPSRRASRLNPLDALRYE